MVCPAPDTGEPEKLFRYEVFRMLKSEGKITDVVIENMKNWCHSGFNVYCSKTIWPHNEVRRRWRKFSPLHHPIHQMACQQSFIKVRIEQRRKHSLLWIGLPC